MIDIVLFTMQGRENLFRTTVRKLSKITPASVGRVIVAIDGPFDLDILRDVAPDLIVMSPDRRGYIGSIRDALAQVNSEFFIWIEDDWDLEGIQSTDISMMLDVMQNELDIVQVRWSKDANLPPDSSRIAENILESTVGFSANPNICRLQHARDGFDYLAGRKHVGRQLGVDGFENVLTDWFAEQRLRCAVLAPGQGPAISHLGELESTGREWHMTSSIRERPLGHGYLGSRPPFWRRLWMIFKLAKAFGIITTLQLMSDEYYELAFRVAVSRRPLRLRWRS